MTRIRLSPSASITPTRCGVVLRSDRGVFELHGNDVRRFLTQMIPLLDGSRDAEGVKDAMPGYSGTSIKVFLTLLTRKGLVETVPDEMSLLADLSCWNVMPNPEMVKAMA